MGPIGLVERNSMNVEAQVKMLHDSVSKFAPTDNCPWELATTFNVLLEEAEKEVRDNPVVASMQPARQGRVGSYATMNCGALAGLTLQLWRAVSSD